MVDSEAVVVLKKIIDLSRSGGLPDGFMFRIDNDKVEAGHWSEELDEFDEQKFVSMLSYDYSPQCLLEDLLAALGIEAQGV